LTALKKSSNSEAETIRQLFVDNPNDPSEKISTVKTIYETSGAAEATLTEIENYTQKANAVLDKIFLSDERKSMLKEFGAQLMNRSV